MSPRRMTDERFRNVRAEAMEDAPHVAGPAVSELWDEARRARSREAELEARVKFLEERERYFAKALGVADGGQYRADWDSALANVVKDLTTERARVKRLEEAAEGFASTAERAVAEAERRASGNKGMQVPFHGDFASGIQLPSVVRELRWWAERFRAALKDTEGTRHG